MKVIISNVKSIYGEVIPNIDIVNKLTEENVCSLLKDNEYFSISKNEEIFIDGKELTLLPAFVDLHVHFRTPGQEEKENLETGSAAALAGGYTTVVTMPNTIPVIDNAAAAWQNELKMRENAKVSIFQVSSITKAMNGKELVDKEEIKKMLSLKTDCKVKTGYGIAAITEDGHSVMDEDLMRKACVQAKELELLIMDHTEDNNLAGGAIHDGEASNILGIRGIPSEAESNIVARDIDLARSTGVRIHLQHISTKESVELIRDAKKDVVLRELITAETAPHYFVLTDKKLIELKEKGLNLANAKMNPPLRGEEDRKAVIDGLIDGTIDCIATDHAPHTIKDKAESLEKAVFGIVGLETAFSLGYTYLVKTGKLTLLELVEKMSSVPANILGMGSQTFNGKEMNAPKDFVLVNLNKSYKIDSEKFHSKGRNTPFDDMEVWGEVMYTIRDKQLVFGKVV